MLSMRADKISLKALYCLFQFSVSFSISKIFEF